MLPLMKFVPYFGINDFFFVNDDNTGRADGVDVAPKKERN